MGGKEG
jgi:hypothetical protein